MSEYKIEELIFNIKEDAEHVVEGLNKVVDTYGTASVADLYDLSGMVGSYKDNGYGWTDVSSAKVGLYDTKDTHGYTIQIDTPVKFK